VKDRRVRITCEGCGETFDSEQQLGIPDEVADLGDGMDA